MATFQPSYGSIGNAPYHAETHPAANQLESFFWKLLVLSALAYFVWSDAIRIALGPVSIEKNEMQQYLSQGDNDLFGLLGFYRERRQDIQLEEGAWDNLTHVIDPGYAARYSVPRQQVHQAAERCSIFVKRFSPVAIAEMRRYGVPASVLLAQALLASNAGDDPICRETNNFFLRSCQPSFCDAAHFTDLDANADLATEVDVFPNLWGSFRAQSLFLRKTAPFSALFELPKNDHRGWAAGLGTGAYSADEQYAEKLIAIIQGLKLEGLDER